MHALRYVPLALLAGCASDGGGDGADLLAPPALCEVMQLDYVHDLAVPGATSGSVAMGGMAFANKVNDQPGELILYAAAGAQGTPPLHIYFSELLIRGQTVPARGALNLPDQGLTAGACDSAPYSGQLTQASEYLFEFALTDLHANTDCSGAAIAGSFAGCYAEQPF